MFEPDSCRANAISQAIVYAIKEVLGTKRARLVSVCHTSHTPLRQTAGAQTTVQPRNEHLFAYTLLTRKVSASPSSAPPHPAALVQRSDPLRTDVVVFESVGTQVADLEFGEAATEIRKRHPARTDKHYRPHKQQFSLISIGGKRPAQWSSTWAKLTPRGRFCDLRDLGSDFGFQGGDLCRLKHTQMFN